jgi:hypothetical protein
VLAGEGLVARKDLREPEPSGLLERGDALVDRGMRVEESRERQRAPTFVLQPVGRALDRKSTL